MERIKDEKPKLVLFGMRDACARERVCELPSGPGFLNFEGGAK